MTTSRRPRRGVVKADAERESGSGADDACFSRLHRFVQKHDKSLVTCNNRFMIKLLDCVASRVLRSWPCSCVCCRDQLLRSSIVVGPLALSSLVVHRAPTTVATMMIEALVSMMRYLSAREDDDFGKYDYDCRLLCSSIKTQNITNDCGTRMTFEQQNMLITRKMDDDDP